MALAARLTMHNLSRGDDGPVQERATDRDADSSDLPALETVDLSYDDRPDRRLVVPADGPIDREQTAWLSANAAAFVDLDASR